MNESVKEGGRIMMINKQNVKRFDVPFFNVHFLFHPALRILLPSYNFQCIIKKTSKKCTNFNGFYHAFTIKNRHETFLYLLNDIEIYVKFEVVEKFLNYNFHNFPLKKLINKNPRLRKEL